MQIWEIETSTIKVGGEIVLEKEGKLQVEDVKRVARERGIKKFIVKDSEGNVLSANDFPYTGTVTIEAYNEAK